MLVPKTVKCPYCHYQFKRGKLTKRMTCPWCSRYVTIYDEKIEFYTWRGDGSRVMRVNRKERKRIFDFLRRKFEVNKM